MTDELTIFREALQSIARNTCCDRCQEAALVAITALAWRDDDREEKCRQLARLGAAMGRVCR